MHPNTMKRTKTWVQGPMGWIRCFGCEKLQRDFMAQTFALIAPVQYVLQQVSCSYETIPNAPKYYETDRNISLGSNGADWVCLLRKKSRRDFAAPTFTLIAPVHPIFHRVSCSYETIPNAPKHYATHQNMSLGSNCVRCQKSRHDFVAWTFALIEPVQYVLQQVSCSYGTIPNAPKYYKTDQNISLGSNRVDWVHSLRKISTWLCGTNFCINCTFTVCFATSFM